MQMEQDIMNQNAKQGSTGNNEPMQVNHGGRCKAQAMSWEIKELTRWENTKRAYRSYSTRPFATMNAFLMVAMKAKAVSISGYKSTSTPHV